MLNKGRFMYSFLFTVVVLLITYAPLSTEAETYKLSDSKFKDVAGTNKKIILAFTGVNDEYTEYAGSIFKEKLQGMGYEIIDPDTLEKVNKERWLKAVINDDTDTMMQIMTGFGADILIRCKLTVESHPRFTNQWESSASLTVTVIDTKTAKEVLSTSGDPLGSTGNPMPVEESALVAKQIAVKKATENVALKLGLSSSEDVYGLTTFSLKKYRTFQTGKRVKNTVFSPDSRIIAVVSESLVELMDVQSNNQVATLEAPGYITALSFSKDGNLIAIGTDSSSVYVYSREDNRLKSKYIGKGSSVTSIAISNDGSVMAAGYRDGHIELADVKHGDRIGYLEGHTKIVHSLAFTPNDKFLVSSSGDLLTKFWDVNVKRETRSFKEPLDRLFFACLSIDGSLMALNAKIIEIDLLRNRRADKRYLVIRNTSTGEEVRRFNLPKDITAIAFYPNKRYIASASKDNTIRLWDINTGAEISVLTLESSAVSLDFSSDGKFLAYAAEGVVTIIKL